MKYIVKKPVKLFDQIERYGEITNVLGFGDPHVEKVDGRWQMFIGGFQTNFKNNLFTASLPHGEPLSSNNWKLSMDNQNPKKAKPLIENSEKGSWDYFGFHTPCYVKGKGKNGETKELIYYTGRASKKVLDNDAPYSIGAIERTAGGWRRIPFPVIMGTSSSPNVLEPKAGFIDGKWRMWYVTTRRETGKKGYPHYTIMYTESDNGLTGWSSPFPLFGEDENYYDASVHPSAPEGFEMLVCRSTNLYGRKPFPKQGLWLLQGTEPDGKRSGWSSDPYCILDAEEGEDWYKHGIGSPSGHYGESEADRNTLYVFFTGLHRERNWMNIALDCLKKKRRPPFPSPFYFTVGRVELTKER
ncbi:MULTISPECIES: hypothetical protein [Bacillus]|uniref:DUF4185 domain-containing protein n=1 Tax=Bacillus infantis TaxID=324767 RepID=A0A5D4SRL0_9BACI|nr:MULTISPECIES: hypothetical protein [Bacillus]PLR73841.1 hypothetical protein CYJ37_10020 [Bacillus sp. UMB0728]TYS65943.1 hypothetical protein FZD47_00170 [Bacillus infantis]